MVEKAECLSYGWVANRTAVCLPHDSLPLAFTWAVISFNSELQTVQLSQEQGMPEHKWLSSE